MVACIFLFIKGIVMDGNIFKYTSSRISAMLSGVFRGGVGNNITWKFDVGLH